MIAPIIFACLSSYFAYNAYIKNEYFHAMIQSFFVGCQIGIIIGHSI